jgi:hypothetical protein
MSADMDKLKEKIRERIGIEHCATCSDGGECLLDGDGWTCICLEEAEAALSAIESAGFVLMPKDQILRKMSKDEFSDLMAGIPFRENDLGCQASPGIKGDTVSREGALQSDIIAEAFDPELWVKADLSTHFHQMQVQGFLYGNRHVVRDCMKERDQIVWEKATPEGGDGFRESEEKQHFMDVYCASLIAAEYGRLRKAANSQGQIDEPGTGDEMTAASDGVCLTPRKINQESDNG